MWVVVTPDVADCCAHSNVYVPPDAPPSIKNSSRQSADDVDDVVDPPDVDELNTRDWKFPDTSTADSAPGVPVPTRPGDRTARRDRNAAVPVTDH